MQTFLDDCSLLSTHVPFCTDANIAAAMLQCGHVPARSAKLDGGVLVLGPACADEPMSAGRPQSVFHSFCVLDSVSRARELMAAHRDLSSLPGVPRMPGEDGLIICTTAL